MTAEDYGMLLAGLSRLEELARAEAEASVPPSLVENAALRNPPIDDRPLVVSLGDLRQRFSSEIEWLVEGYIPRSALTIIPGPPESFKSFAMADLARAVHTGGKWLGHFDVPQGTVLYIEQERARNLVYQVTQLEKGHNIDLSALLTIPPTGVNILDAAWQVRLSTLIKQLRPAVAVLNSFRAVFHGKPSDGAQIAAALNWLGRAAEEVGCAAIITDQVNKVGALGGARGLAAHSDSLQKAYEADAILHIERDRDPVGRGGGPA
jgi:RecA-family ATPase